MDEKMYTLRFPAHFGPKLASVLEQHGITDSVSKNKGEIELTLEERDYVSLRFDLRGSRLEPKGGWPPLCCSVEESCDPDRPQTVPPSDFDLR